MQSGCDTTTPCALCLHGHQKSCWPGFRPKPPRNSRSTFLQQPFRAPAAARPPFFWFVSCPPFVAVYLDFRVPMGTKDDQLRLKEGERARSECQKWLWRVSGFWGFCFHVLDARLSRRSTRHSVGEVACDMSLISELNFDPKRDHTEDPESTDCVQ